MSINSKQLNVLTYELTACVSVTLQAPVLTASPASHVFSSGGGVTLTCSSSHQSSSTQYKYYLSNILYRHNLSPTWTLSSLSAADSGEYTCRVIVGGVESDRSNVYGITVVGKLIRNVFIEFCFIFN